MKVDRKAAIKKLRTLVLTSKMEVDSFRAGIERTFGTVFLPNNVECTEWTYGGVPCDLLVPEVFSSQRIIIYIHGGSFVGGSRSSWRNFCSSVAHATSCRVVVPEFRLPPTHPFPASVDDVESVFRAIYAEAEVAASMKGPAEAISAQLIIAADGSGASIALATMFRLEKPLRACVHNIVLFSPWLDLTSENPLIGGRRVADEVISGEDLHRAVDMYTYANNIENPQVSPLKAGAEAFSGFPPLYIQMGEKEILNQQAQELAGLLKQAGVEYILDVWPGMMYMFQMADEFLPDSHLAVEKVGKYIRKREAESEDERQEREKILRKNNITPAD